MNTDEEARVDNGDTKPLLDAMRAMELRLNAVTADLAAETSLLLAADLDRIELRAEIAALTAERDALLKKHRSVCRACAMLDANPNAPLADFLAKMKTKPQTNDN